MVDPAKASTYFDHGAKFGYSVSYHVLI